MKTILFICIICLYTTLTFGQKKEIYFNDDLVKITKSEFDKESDIHKSYDLKFNLDTLIVNIKVQRIKKGKVAKTKLDSIRNELSLASKRDIPERDIIIVNYYHGLDKCNSSGNKSSVKIRYQNYLKRVKKLKNVSQFFLYKSLEGTDGYGKQLNWLKDPSGIIAKTFLPIQYPCGSYVIIDENGNYYAHKGEYNIDNITRLVRNKKKTFANSENN